MSQQETRTCQAHPQPWPALQSLLPRHSESEVKALRKSIMAHGVLENGVYWVDEEHNQWILDGVHRRELSEGEMTWRPCGVPPGNEEEALALGLALNLAKRNPSPEQLREVWDSLQARKTVLRLTALKLRGEGKTQAEAAALVGIDQAQISRWEKGDTNNMQTHNTCIPEAPDLRVSIPKQYYEKIYLRHTEGDPQVRIAADYKVSQQAISGIISKERSRLSATPTEGDMEQGGELGLFKGLKYTPKPWDVWNYTIDRQYGVKHPGNIPAGIVFNLLYFYTEPGDLIVDPMAGGGVVGDACAITDRRCRMFDLNPVRPDITKHDLAEGFPVEGANLVFLDPPYYKKIEDEYGPNSVSALPREDYLKFFKNLAETVLASGARRVALLMSDYYDDEDPHGHIFIWHYVHIFEAAGWIPERHIIAPLPTQQVHPDFVEKFRKSKKLARLGRSLVIFRRP